MSEIEFEELKRELKTLLSGYKKLTPEMIKKKRNYGICFCKKKESFHFRLFSSRKKELDLKLLEQQAIVVPAKKACVISTRTIKKRNCFIGRRCYAEIKIELPHYRSL